MQRGFTDTSFSEMPLNKLCVYLIETQHPNLQKSLQTLQKCSDSVKVWNPDPVVSDTISKILLQLIAKIRQHLDEDTGSLFPYLVAMTSQSDPKNIKGNNVSLSAIRALHASILSLFSSLRDITKNYEPEPGSASSLKLCYAQLFNLEQDFIKHNFLEEEILFPRLIQLDKMKNNEK